MTGELRIIPARLAQLSVRVEGTLPKEAKTPNEVVNIDAIPFDPATPTPISEAIARGNLRQFESNLKNKSLPLVTPNGGTQTGQFDLLESLRQKLASIARRRNLKITPPIEKHTRNLSGN